MATPAQPNGLDHFRAGEPIRVLRGKANPSGFDHFRATEPIVGLDLPSSWTGSSSYSIVIGYTSAGVRGAVGASSWPIHLTYDSAGVRGALGASSWPIHLTYNSEGVVTVVLRDVDVSHLGIYWFYRRDGWNYH